MGLKVASFPAILLAFGVGLTPNAATACISGPLPLNFIGKTASLDETDKFLLKNYGSERPSDTFQVIFYKSGVPANIVRERERNVRAYLTSIPRRNISVVQSPKPLPRSLADMFGQQTTATVEVTHGCF